MFTWIAVGLIAGFAAAVFLGMGKTMPWWQILLGGVLGAALGVKTMNFFELGRGSLGLNWPSLVASFLGSLVVIFIFREFFAEHRD